MNKRVYISLPITGLPDKQVKRKAELTKKLLKAKGYVPLSPLEIAPEPDKPISYYMGLDIMALLECHSIFLCRGWEKSNGCLLEYHAAKIYGLELMFEEGAEKPFEITQNSFCNHCGSAGVCSQYVHLRKGCQSLLSFTFKVEEALWNK